MPSSEIQCSSQFSSCTEDLYKLCASYILPVINYATWFYSTILCFNQFDTEPQICTTASDEHERVGNMVPGNVAAHKISCSPDFNFLFYGSKEKKLRG